MNKYNVFEVKYNREKGWKEFADKMKAPINNLFDEHNYCGVDCFIKKDDIKRSTHQSAAMMKKKKNTKT